MADFQPASSGMFPSPVWPARSATQRQAKLRNLMDMELDEARPNCVSGVKISARNDMFYN